jgi:hypothetical protein
MLPSTSQFHNEEQVAQEEQHEYLLYEPIEGKDENMNSAFDILFEAVLLTNNHTHAHNN